MGDAEEEELLPVLDGARRANLPVGEFRRRLVSSEVVLVRGLEFRLRASNIVAVTPARRHTDETPRWQRIADRARDELRSAARRGDREAQRALHDIGELCAPRHWADEQDDA